ncbi:hypothetical protein Pr1d_41990 [Bythopirellula goksoeyrii]|uniref:Secreted protein n=1 Tax=Bythopirellula goksoeyrii TaxID=1400387 RepID=A0A5B9QGY1_9BACT|nr:hypothetical protein Pr1d_41990 [Bythopirellula goksoeyrii]
MHRFVAILAVLSVLAHATVGCCAHSAHFAPCHAQTTIDCELTDIDSSHEHHSDHKHPGSPCESTPGEQHECQHIKCQWLPSSSSVDVSVGSPFNSDCVICDIVILQPDASVSLHRLTQSELLLGLSLRSHLALGILLI